MNCGEYFQVWALYVSDNIYPNDPVRLHKGGW
jgi:hypothetical protein